MQLDQVATILAKADKAAADEQWEQADELYSEALGLMPPDRAVEARRVRLERAKAQMLAKQLPSARLELKQLVEDLEADPADRGLLAEARAALANAQYHTTWLMRLEGYPREDWEPEIEAARQNFSLLAEQAESRRDPAGAKQYEEDLESAIRLARMDLDELQGLPMPCQCNCKGSKTSQRSSKKPGKNKITARQTDNRSNGAGPPPDTGGH
jgi:hypothetical protein